MRTRFCVLLLILAAAAVSSETASEPVAWVNGHPVYGEAFDAGVDAIGVAELLAGAEALDGRTVAVKGRIGQVCQTKGCWLMLSEGEQAVRVFTRGHAYFVPKDSHGSALVVGQISEHVNSEAFARHLAEDGGEDPDSIEGERVEYRFDADSIMIISEATQEQRS